MSDLIKKLKVETEKAILEYLEKPTKIFSGIYYKTISNAIVEQLHVDEENLVVLGVIRFSDFKSEIGLTNSFIIKGELTKYTLSEEEQEIVELLNQAKPCPLCGKYELNFTTNIDDAEYDNDYIACMNTKCLVDGAIGETRQIALEKWNTRFNI